jgi:hypothetical protein
MYGEESGFGSEATANSYFGRVTNFNFDQTNSLIKDYDVGDRDVQNFLIGPVGVTGNVNFDVIDFGVFKYVLGSKTGSGTGASPYVYTSADAIPSITIEAGHRGTTNMNFTFIGCRNSSTTLNFARDEKLTCTSNWTIKTYKEDATVQTYTTPTTAPFTYMQGALQRNDSNLAGVERGSITITNNLIENREYGNRLLTDLKSGQLDIAFEFTLYLDSALATTLLSDAYGQVVGSGPILTGLATMTGFTLDLELDDGANRVVTISLGTATINEWGSPVDVGNNMVMLRVGGFAKTITITEQVSA